jgi:hypothetical protein
MTTNIENVQELEPREETSEKDVKAEKLAVWKKRLIKRAKITGLIIVGFAMGKNADNFKDALGKPGTEETENEPEN